MDGFTAKRKFRGNTYQITVRNPAHVQKGVTKLIVDGATIDGNMIPAINGTGHDVTVEVTMGLRYQTGLCTASNMTLNTKMPPQSKLYGGI